jgi:uncharacterized membrane protein
MLAHVTIIPATVFLVLEPRNKKRFVSFHSFQNIFFCVSWIVIGIAVSIVAATRFCAGGSSWFGRVG